MSISVLVGAQWGDEGKGKMIDYLSKDCDLIVRFQGGDNAGHTVINEHGVFKLHLIPSGIFNKGGECLIGTGTVVNPDVLEDEIKQIEDAGVRMSGLKISGKAHILMPYHQKLDELMEAAGGIGTTKRGIGQAYSYKALRKNLRFEDLLNLNSARKKLEAILPVINNQMRAYGAEDYTVDFLYEKCEKWAERFASMIVDPIRYLHSYIDADKNILFEGQLAAMKDIDLGIYPYVTSSNPTAAYAAVSGGFSAKKIDRVIGVAKAFSSAVGAGPFPTEEFEGDIDLIRGKGDKPDDEFGARTGRSRRLGWLDIPVLKYTNLINGFDTLALCKIDKLDNLPEIKVCVAYELDGEVIDYFPNTEELERVKPVYETLPGWMCSTKEIRRLEDLPENAKKYIKTIEELVGTTVGYVGVGPDREELAV
ncbi:adenylosuccinate synthase [Eubacterium callanderi]|uniref:adenylosuccinate synthase n=1 Tax=Eubacterium callanderi TaxID=53442 RepID=UPI001AA0C8CD|nr:adenylosuccinate synthase [Eubacterium callanderi]MBO1703078.1 adenylosuccinate synthase [Eubacterium callanderi]MDR4073448.1 adenylosuccinate synthase [Eubacterium sp.]